MTAKASWFSVTHHKVEMSACGPTAPHSCGLWGAVTQPCPSRQPGCKTTGRARHTARWPMQNIPVDGRPGTPPGLAMSLLRSWRRENVGCVADVYCICHGGYSSSSTFNAVCGVAQCPASLQCKHLQNHQQPPLRIANKHKSHYGCSEATRPHKSLPGRKPNQRNHAGPLQC